MRGIRRAARTAGVAFGLGTLAALLLVVSAGGGTAAGGVPQQGVVRAGDVSIHYWPDQDRLATSLLPDAGAPGFVGLPSDVLNRGREITVYLAPDAERFDSLTGGRAPEWGAGVALPQQGIIIIPGYVSERTGTHTLPVILRHELAHVALQRHLGRASVPRWFTEGYATWTAGQFDESEGWMLRLALLTGRAPPLDSLTLDWPLIASDARLAYLLSASAVSYLHAMGRPDTFERLLEHWAETGSFEQALRTVYIVSSPQFERLWIEHAKRRYGWLQVAAQTLFIWTVLSVLVLVFFLIRRRRNRLRMAALRADELPDQPAYWMPAPPGPPQSDTPAGRDVTNPGSPPLPPAATDGHPRPAESERGDAGPEPPDDESRA